MIIFTLHVKISKFLFRLLATRLKIKLTKCVYPRDFARLFSDIGHPLLPKGREDGQQ